MKKSSADELGNNEPVRTFDHSIIVYISIRLFKPNFEEIESECCEGTIIEEDQQEVSSSTVTWLRLAKQYVSCPNLPLEYTRKDSLLSTDCLCSSVSGSILSAHSQLIRLRMNQVTQIFLCPLIYSNDPSVVISISTNVNL